MKNKLLLILMIITMFTSGCTKESENTNLIKGQEKLESYQYDEALTLLSQVLDEDPENETARAMYMQARKMDIAQEYEDNYDYEKAIKELNDIVNIDNGSKKIKRESINKKAELEKLHEEAEKEALQRKENAKQASKENASKSESIINNYNKKQKENEENKENKENIQQHENTQQSENTQQPEEEKSETKNEETLDTNTQNEEIND